MRVAATVHDLVTEELDVYAPCALGGALNDETVPVLRAQVVCGAANNQLAHAGIAEGLRQRVAASGFADARVVRR